MEWIDGDFFQSGGVDSSDTALFWNSYNTLHPAPEPGTVGLLVFAAAALALRAGGRRLWKPS